jgi:hypothetical protein
MQCCWQLQPGTAPDCSGTAVAVSTCGATLATAAAFVLQARLHCLSCCFAVRK